MSILSDREDGFGFFYGFRRGDHRQVNVRFASHHGWVGYVGGEIVARTQSKKECEQECLAWMDKNPVEAEQ